MALVALGVHLAADRLDDQLWAAMSRGSDQLDSVLTEPLARAAETVGLGFDSFLVWQELPLPVVAAALSLVLELIADVMLWDAFLLTPKQTRWDWARYRSKLSLRAIVIPIALAGALASGAWSLFMAAEDLLPTHDASTAAAAALSLLALVHYGSAALRRGVGNLERPEGWKRQVMLALVLLPVGLTAWRGLPLWGWLP